jgi:hypothetical protein
MQSVGLSHATVQLAPHPSLTATNRLLTIAPKSKANAIGDASPANASGSLQTALSKAPRQKLTSNPPAHGAGRSR